MDLLPYWFLIGIVLMSGGIAVLADDVGRRLGKKRLHVRGLRPKHVAQIGTFLAGICVSFGTILVVAMLSSSVRQWIREGNVAIAKVKAVEAQYDTAKRQLTAAQHENARLSDSNSRLEGATSKAQKQLVTTRAEEAQLASRMDDIRSRLAELRISYASANNRIGDLNGEVKRRKQLVLFAQRRLSDTDQQLAGVNQKLAAAAQTEKQVVGGLKVAIVEKRQTDQDNQRLNEEKEHLTQQKAALEKESADASAQYALISKDLDNAKQAVAQANAELKETQDELQHTMGEAAFFQKIATAPRYEPPIYLRGDEVARLSIAPGLSFANAQSELLSLLRAARIEAKAKGADSHGTQPEALIVEHKDPDTGEFKSPDELERDVATRIAGAQEPMVLIASSSLNAFRGESVSLEIEAMPNPVVYARNALVAKTDVDGRGETDAILRQVAALVRKVEERAKADQMIPRLGAQEMYGAVPSDEVLHLVNEVKATNRAVEIRAFADADTRAADPLRLRFSVR